MTDTPLDTIITTVKESVLCGSCKSAKFMVWQAAELDESFGEHGPQHAVATQDGVYAVHCDYYRRRIEAPNRLISCHAHQSGEAPTGQDRTRKRR